MARGRDHDIIRPARTCPAITHHRAAMSRHPKHTKATSSAAVRHYPGASRFFEGEIELEGRAFRAVIANSCLDSCHVQLHFQLRALAFSARSCASAAAATRA